MNIKRCDNCGHTQSTADETYDDLSRWFRLGRGLGYGALNDVEVCSVSCLTQKAEAFLKAQDEADAKLEAELAAEAEAESQ